MFLDAKYCRAGVHLHQAIGIAADGRRGSRVLRFDVGDTEWPAFWTDFLRTVKARSPVGRGR